MAGDVVFPRSTSYCPDCPDCPAVAEREFGSRNRQISEVDPVTHTLVGAALAEGGLKRRTALGTATLLIGANLPDIDLLSLFWGSETGLWFRRGVTHSVLAVGVLPFLLTGIMVLWGRLRRRPTGALAQAEIRPGALLLLSFVAVLTHPLLDFLNVYGMRWLMPFSDEWSYGDTLFIVDPWIWAMLTAGVYTARQIERRHALANPEPPSRYRSTFPARMALLAVSAYILVMGASNLSARGLVTRSVERQGITPVRLMVAPVAVNPFTRWVVVEDQDVYHFGRLHWLPRPRLELSGVSYAKFPSHPAAGAALRGPDPRKFLSWARFPYNQIEDRDDAYIVHIGDARYTLDPQGSWAAMSVRIGKR